jgi:excisionase family DNA binding protein
MIAGMKGYMTSKELAARLGITPSGVLMQIHRGVLVAEKIGRDWVITEEDAKHYEIEHAGKRGTASPRHPGTGGRPKGRTEPDGGG